MVFPVLGFVGARAIGSTIRTPFDVVKQHMQVQGSITAKHRSYKTTYEAIQNIWKQQGLRLFSLAPVALVLVNTLMTISS